MKIAVIGGGSSYTPELLTGFLEMSEEIDEVFLFDVEEGREKLNKIYDFAQRYVEGKLKIKKTFDFEEAVKDADYIIFQFRPGGLKARYLDETIPLKYNLVGQETTGVGGFMAALRGFPVVERYVELVRKNSDGWIINFTNPSGHITEFVRNTIGFDKYVGLCNIPVNIIRAISEKLGVKEEDIFLKYYGINHLTFLEKIYVKNKDVTKKILELVKYSPSNIPYGDFPDWLVLFLELFPNPYLHYYFSERKMVEKLKNSQPRAQLVMEIERELFKEYEKLSKIPGSLSKRGGSLYSTAAATLVRDLHRGDGKVHIINTKNMGAISNLPDDYVLEIPTYVRGGRVFPISLGEGDLFALSYIHSIKMYERLTVEAYISRSKKKALKALLSHPLGPDIEFARELLEELFMANEEWIGKWE